MNRIPLNAGRVVRSMAGRDEGRLFVIVRELDEEYVMICDGSLRKIDRPKKKKRRHLRATTVFDGEVGERVMRGETLMDHEIRRILRAAQPDKEG